MVRTTFRTYHVLSEEEREQIVRAYLNSGDTIEEAAKRYGVSARSLKRWLKIHRQGVRRVEKALFLQEKKQEQKPAEMKPQTPEEELVYLRKELDKAQQELTEAKRALATSELRNEALNTLIDIAERQGIKIRKNSGAKR
jgi:transposase-like protein